MKKIIREIRQQPPHIREAFMWVCVVITFSVIGFAWFRTVSKQVVVLLNPSEAVEEPQTVAQKSKPPSPLATLFISFSDLKANIFELFDFAKEGNELEIFNSHKDVSQEPIEPLKLPVSGDK